VSVGAGLRPQPFASGAAFPAAPPKQNEALAHPESGGSLFRRPPAVQRLMQRNQGFCRVASGWARAFVLYGVFPGSIPQRPRRTAPRLKSLTGTAAAAQRPGNLRASRHAAQVPSPQQPAEGLSPAGRWA